MDILNYSDAACKFSRIYALILRAIEFVSDSLATCIDRSNRSQAEAVLKKGPKAAKTGLDQKGGRSSVKSEPRADKQNRSPETKASNDVKPVRQRSKLIPEEIEYAKAVLREQTLKYADSKLYSCEDVSQTGVQSAEIFLAKPSFSDLLNHLAELGENTQRWKLRLPKDAPELFTTTDDGGLAIELIGAWSDAQANGLVEIAETFADHGIDWRQAFEHILPGATTRFAAFLDGVEHASDLQIQNCEDPLSIEDQLPPVQKAKSADPNYLYEIALTYIDEGFDSLWDLEVQMRRDGLELAPDVIRLLNQRGHLDQLTLDEDSIDYYFEIAKCHIQDGFNTFKSLTQRMVDQEGWIPGPVLNKLVEEGLFMSGSDYEGATSKLSNEGIELAYYLGNAYARKGIKTAKELGAKLVEEFGDAIKPHLSKIFDQLAEEGMIGKKLRVQMTDGNDTLTDDAGANEVESAFTQGLAEIGEEMTKQHSNPQEAQTKVAEHEIQAEKGSGSKRLLEHIGNALPLSRIFVFLLFILFVIFVYPTPYEYTRKFPDVYRVNRFTGVQYQSTSTGWKTEKEIAAEYEEEIKANREKSQADELKVAEFAKSRSLSELTVQSTKFRCQIAWKDSSMRYEFFVSESETNKSAFATGTFRNDLKAIFLDKDGFEVTSITKYASDFIRDATKSGYVLSAEQYLSREDYEAIAGWNVITTLY